MCVDRQISDEDDCGVVLADCNVGKRTAQESGRALADQVTERADVQAARTGTVFLPDTLSLGQWGMSRISEKTGDDLFQYRGFCLSRTALILVSEL